METEKPNAAAEAISSQFYHLHGELDRQLSRLEDAMAEERRAQTEWDSKQRATQAIRDKRSIIGAQIEELKKAYETLTGNELRRAGRGYWST